MKKMVLLTLVMLVGVIAAVVGNMMADADGYAAIGVPLVWLGLPVAAVSLIWLLRLHRRYQDEALAEVLANPAEIVARWQARGERRILAERGLFLGRSYHAFAGYQALQRMLLKDDVLELVFGTGDSTRRRYVEVPPELVPAVQAFVERWTGRAVGPAGEWGIYGPKR